MGPKRSKMGSTWHNQGSMSEVVIRITVVIVTISKVFREHFGNLAGLYLFSFMGVGGSIPFLLKDPAHESLGSKPQPKVCSADCAVGGVLNLISATIVAIITTHDSRL